MVVFQNTNAQLNPDKRRKEEEKEIKANDKEKETNNTNNIIGRIYEESRHILNSGNDHRQMRVRTKNKKTREKSRDKIF